MPIVFCDMEIHIPHSQSLKTKRNVLRKTTERLRARFNFSISEIGHQDTWQRARIGAVSIGHNRRDLERLSEKLVRETEKILGSDLVRYEIEIIDYE